MHGNQGGQRPAHGLRSVEAGETLVEVLVALILLGVLSLGVLVGFSSVVVAGNVDRVSSTNAAVARNAIAELAAAPYVNCGSAATYDAALQAAYAVPAGSAVHVTAVEYWTLASNPPTFHAGSCSAAATPRTAGGDSGLERLTITATSTRNRSTITGTRTLLKRSDAAYAEPVGDPPAGGHTCTISVSGGAAQVDSNWVEQTVGQTNAVHQNDQHMDILYLNGTRRFSYLRFQISPTSVCDEGGTLGAGHTILTARLSLYTYNIGGLPACGANSCWHALEAVPRAWSASSLTWNNQPCPGGGSSVPSCRADGAKGIEFQHGTGALDWSARFQVIEAPQLTADVQGFYANPATNFGWRIREACDGGAGPYNHACGDITPGFQFRSKNAPAVSQSPHLAIVYQ